MIQKSTVGQSIDRICVLHMGFITHYFANTKNRPMHSPQLIRILAIAQPVIPSLMSSKVSKLKVEKVLRPPQIPIIIKAL